MPKKASNPKKSIKIPLYIIISVKLCEIISRRLVVIYAAKLFTTPIKHKFPGRENEMYQKSIRKIVPVSSIKKSINLYQYGTGEDKILLVHGWSGRGTQLFKIADALLEKGYGVVSFDAPAHGLSEGKATSMSEFIESILEINKLYGPFQAAVGHSLGGMSVLKSIASGLQVDRAIVISSGNVVKEMLDDFVSRLQLKAEISSYLQDYFEKKYTINMDDFSSYRSARQVDVPVLVIHDEDDPDIPVKSAFHIHSNLRNGALYTTKGLGHRKILGNQDVIENITKFVTNHQ
jgi:pimeloyl-ACP methyl ester carboxylesterase